MANRQVTISNKGKAEIKAILWNEYVTDKKGTYLNNKVATSYPYFSFDYIIKTLMSPLLSHNL